MTLYRSYMIDRRLKVLRAVERHGTVTAAAEVCRLTPSAASHQIQALARELDVVLLEPAGRGVRLTAAARTLLAHGQTLTGQWERAQADLAAHRAGDVGGRLRFCAFSTAAAAIVPQALDRLRRDHPGLHLQLLETEPARSFDLLAADDADIAVVVATPDIPPVSYAAFDQRVLYDEPLDVLVGPEHSLVGRDDVALSDLAADPWICANPGRAYHQLVTLACASAGFAPDIAHHADEWDTGAALVARGFGVALVPRLAELPTRHDTRRIVIGAPPVPIRRVVVAVRAGSQDQPAIAAGLEALRHVCASLSTTAIRPARGEDLDDLQALARRTIDRCYRAFLGDDVVDRFIGSGASDAHVKNHLEQGGVHCLIAREGRIIGFSIVDGPTIDLMMVDPDHHRRGLGRLLLQHAEAALLAHHTTIRLESFADNAAANAFYEACGWRQGDRMAEGGPAKIEYVKSVTGA
jgi:DNA-binding transcriptional LysR family regulator/ribosomal protein S18 acetylase RimI-like enzyme